MKRLSILFIIGVSISSLLLWGEVAPAFCDIDKEMQKAYTFEDGASIIVHYDKAELKRYHPDPDAYVDIVFQSAKDAYKEIVYKQGFDAPGFTFANPDKGYRYDKDTTIDIYITKDSPEAPCYDIVSGSGNDYDAIIVFPADYPGYLAKTKGVKKPPKTTLAKRIRGSLFHEMTHVILYSYNRNVAPWYNPTKDRSYHQGGDWYVEGLARYFETIAGSYENFFSKGYIRKEGNKRIISQDGANFFMTHPTGSLKKARYDYSLFWAYLHDRYGMERIEEFSRRLRFIKEGGMKEELPVMLSKVLGEEFDDILKGFAVAVYFKSFNLDIKERLCDQKAMTLDDFSKMKKQRVSAWANNFIVMDLEDKAMPKTISLKKTDENSNLRMTIIADLEDGRRVQLKDLHLNDPSMSCRMNLADMKSNGVQELLVIITNSGAERYAGYEILQY